MAPERVVLSNVLLDIPNESLIPLLHKFGEPTSHISQLSISTVHPDLKHMKSKIIQVMEKIPHTINVEHDGVTYLIYVTCDDGTCINCRKRDHVAKNCHTIAQSRIGPITLADRGAGRQFNTPLHNLPSLHRRPQAQGNRRPPLTTQRSSPCYLSHGR
jgi:hypothetical protein